MWNMADQQMKYAEVMAVAGGVTAVQGSPSSNTDAWDSMLSRNIELYNFGGDGIHTKVTTLESDYTGSHITSGNSSGSLNAWYLHLSEGVDESSRAEFDILVQNNLLVGELVVVHGTSHPLSSKRWQKLVPTLHGHPSQPPVVWRHNRCGRC